MTLLLYVEGTTLNVLFFIEIEFSVDIKKNKNKNKDHLCKRCVTCYFCKTV